MKANNVNFFPLAVNSISITTRGKNAAIDAGAIPNLVNLLGHSSSEVRLNACKVSLTIIFQIFPTLERNFCVVTSDKPLGSSSSRNQE